MNQIKPGADGFPRYMFHPIEKPVIVNNTKEFQDLMATDPKKRWSDRYIHQYYPQTMYHKSGAFRDVTSDKEKRDLGNGWRDKPYETTAGNTPEQDAVAAENSELKAKLAEMQELLAQQTAPTQ